MVANLSSNNFFVQFLRNNFPVKCFSQVFLQRNIHLQLTTQKIRFCACAGHSDGLWYAQRLNMSKISLKEVSFLLLSDPGIETNHQNCSSLCQNDGSAPLHRAPRMLETFSSGPLAIRMVLRPLNSWNSCLGTA